MSLSVLYMNQTEECATKRIFGVMISNDSIVCKRLPGDFLAGLTVFSLATSLFYILIFVLYRS